MSSLASGEAPLPPYQTKCDGFGLLVAYDDALVRSLLPPGIEPVTAKLRHSSPVAASNTATRFPVVRKARNSPSGVNATGWTDPALVFSARVSGGLSPRKS